MDLHRDHRLAVIRSRERSNTHSSLEGGEREESATRPSLRAAGPSTVRALHDELGDWTLTCSDGPTGAPTLLFTENETNDERLFGRANSFPYVKDGISDYVVSGTTDTVNPRGEGTKASAHYRLTIAAHASVVLELRLSRTALASEASSERVFKDRKADANAFYDALQLNWPPPGLGRDAVVQAVVRLQRTSVAAPRFTRPGARCTRSQSRLASLRSLGRDEHAGQVESTPGSRLRISAFIASPWPTWTPRSRSSNCC